MRLLKPQSVFVPALLVIWTVGMQVDAPSYAQQNVTKLKGWQKDKNFCQITLLESGVLRPSVDSMELGSRFAGGRSGIVEVSTGGNRFWLSIDQPLGFDLAPPQGNDDVTITASFSGHGATNFAETSGNFSTKLKRGVTRVETHLAAQRFSAPFPAGEYGTTLTIRCE